MFKQINLKSVKESPAKRMLRVESKIDKKEPKSTNKSVMKKHDMKEAKKMEGMEEMLVKKSKK